MCAVPIRKDSPFTFLVTASVHKTHIQTSLILVMYVCKYAELFTSHCCASCLAFDDITSTFTEASLSAVSFSPVHTFYNEATVRRSCKNMSESETESAKRQTWARFVFAEYISYGSPPR